MKTASNKTSILKSADKHLRQAREYFERSKVVPDAGDLTIYIVDILKKEGIPVSNHEYVQIFKHLGGLRSPNACCRKFGCITSSRGYYYGMPQSHCWVCGMKTYHGADFCKDFEEPLEPNYYPRWFVWLAEKIFKW